MGEAVFVRILFKEQVHPRPGKKLHAHRVDFSGFVGREGIFRHKQAAAGIHLERVAYFMGQYIDIS
ncbi:hypothetical protein D3C81_1870810 [compost metagenome]